MELQHQRLCVKLDDLPVLEGTTSLDTTRAILQERSANRPHDFDTQSTGSVKHSRSPIPTVNFYARRALHAGNFFTGNVHAQHIRLAGFGAEKSEKQVDIELKRLYRMLQRSDKYQKYREKQSPMTAAEVIEKEAREAAEKKAKEDARKAAGEPAPKNDKTDNTVWPEFLEQAFWRCESQLCLSMPFEVPRA